MANGYPCRATKIKHSKFHTKFIGNESFTNYLGNQLAMAELQPNINKKKYYKNICLLNTFHRVGAGRKSFETLGH